MTQQNLDFGTGTPNDGEFLGTAFLKIQENFDELYAGNVTLADLFLASGAAINFNAGDVTITHAANALTIAGASTGITFSGMPTTWSGSISNTSGAQWLYVPTITTSVAGSAEGMYVVPTFNLTNGTPPTTNALYVLPIVAAGNANIASFCGIFSSVSTAASYTNTLAFGTGFFAGDPSLGGTKPITFFSGFGTAPITNGNAITTGTVTNYGYYSDYINAAAGVGGTVVNFGYWAGVPNGSTAGTTNYGIHIDGDGGASAAANWALHSSSAANSLFSGNVGIGTTPISTALLDISANAANVVSQVHASTDTAGQRAQFFARRSRNTRASPTIVQSGDSLGSVLFAAYDGAAYINCAEVLAEVDGTPGANDMPSRLVFKTTPDGSATRAEYLRIDSRGFTSLTGSFGRGAPVTETGTTHTVAATTNHLICDQAGTVTVTLPTASAWTGREIYIKTITANTVVSASSNVAQSTTATAGTGILPNTDGAWALLVSDGTNWIVMAANPLV